LDDPALDQDASWENLANPAKPDAPDREQCIRERAYELWELAGRQEGTHERHWHDAVREIDDEDGATRPPA
jgi:hypothetical protein